MTTAPFLTRTDQSLWASPEARALRKILANAYGPQPESKLQLLLASVDVDTGEINWNQGPNDLWQRAMEVALAAGRLAQLVDAVLEDPDKAGFHDAIRGLVAGDQREDAPIDADGAPASSTAADRAAGATPDLSPEYRQLHDLLTAADGSAAADDTQPAASTHLPAALLTQVLALAPTAQSLEAYRLARLAWWLRPQNEPDLDRRFTRLTLVLDQGEKAEGQRWQSQAERYTDLRQVLAAVEGRHPVLVLLGEPGAGKTTLLRRLELDLALDALGRPVAGPAEEPVTFYLRLSDYQEREQGPRQWVAARWQEAWPRLETLDQLLAAGRPVLLLLDALNEMPHGGQPEYEARLAAWSQDLLRWTRERPALRVLFSCRSLDYSAPLSCDDLPVPQVQVNRLADEQIQDFLAHYLPGQAEAVWRQLAADERQLDLFRTPYYLSLLTQQVGPDGAIPAGRAALFTGFVRQALRRELVDKQLRLLTEGDLLSERDRRRIRSSQPWPQPHSLPDEGPLIGQLAGLAYGMQERSAANAASQITVAWTDALALLTSPRDDLLEAGAALGLLEPDELRETLRFRHQLLQEYFAARRLAQQPDATLVRSPWRADEVPEALADTIARLPDAEPLPPLPATGWEETSLLMAELLPPDAAAAYVQSLLTANLPLAGRAAASAALALPESLRDAIRQALVARTQDEAADLRARIAAGLALGLAGDPRFERRQGPFGDYLMPPLITIPAGTYPIGSDDSDWHDERPAHTVTLPAYRIGQFPVTNAEYACFVEAGGYRDERWWDTEEARAWLRGDEASVEASRQEYFALYSGIPKDDAGFEQWCAGRPRLTSAQVQFYNRVRQMSPEEILVRLAYAYRPEKHNLPNFWDDSAFNNPAQPVIGVSWYEAHAYCAWLSAQCGLAVALPSDPEWEASARGLKGRVYPFGPVHDPAKSNTVNSHIRCTTPVGVYPSGGTPRGVMDLSGNVWEWTRSFWSRTAPIMDFPYPYFAHDRREAPSAPVGAARVVRGGSWHIDHYFARTTYRFRAQPNDQSYDLGFRLVVSSPISPDALAPGAA